VIVPTLASKERSSFLDRALDSIAAQDVAATAIVVANGDATDRDVLDRLRKRDDIRFIHAASTTLPDALRVGREQVDTAFFAELDDDDELLPTAISSRLAVLEADDSCAAVISNAWMRSAHGTSESIPDVELVRADPLRALIELNWLVPGAAVFRASVVTADYFGQMPQYLEWTYLALRLALDHRLEFLASPTTVHWVGLPFSINDSSECQRARPGAVERLLELPLPVDLRRALEEKRAGFYHEIADARIANGDHLEAWGAHLRSLLSPSGRRYLSFTRHLLRSKGHRKSMG